MGSEYIVAGVVQQQRQWLWITIVVTAMLALASMFLTPTPKATYKYEADRVIVVIPVYHKKAGWLLYTNTFYNHTYYIRTNEL